MVILGKGGGESFFLMQGRVSSAIVQMNVGGSNLLRRARPCDGGARSDSAFATKRGRNTESDDLDNLASFIVELNFITVLCE